MFDSKEFTFTELTPGSSYTLTVFAMKGDRQVELLKQTYKTGVVGESEDDPIIISTKEEFLKMADDGTKYYKLADHIDFGGASMSALFTSTSTVTTEKKAFSGQFDGAGFTIKNIDIKDEVDVNKSEVSIFGIVTTGTIKNVVFDNIKIDNTVKTRNSSSYIAIVASRTTATTATLSQITIKNSHIKYTQGNSSQTVYIGSLVGNLQGTASEITIEDSSITVDAVVIKEPNTSNSAGTFIGGAIGRIDDSKAMTIEKISADVDITFTLDQSERKSEKLGRVYIGGVIGIHNGFVAVTGKFTEQLIAKGSVKVNYNVHPESTNLTRFRVGGIAGSANARFKEIYATNEIVFDANRIQNGHKIASLVAETSSSSLLALAHNQVIITYDNNETTDTIQTSLYNNIWSTVLSDIKKVVGSAVTVNEVAQTLENETISSTDIKTYFTSDWIKTKLS